MPSGWLAFATRRVNLMAASMRAPLALCTDGMTILPPTKRGKKSTRWWFEFKARLQRLLLWWVFCTLLFLTSFNYFLCQPESYPTAPRVNVPPERNLLTSRLGRVYFCMCRATRVCMVCLYYTWCNWSNRSSDIRYPCKTMICLCLCEIVLVTCSFKFALRDFEVFRANMAASQGKRWRNHQIQIYAKWVPV